MANSSRPLKKIIRAALYGVVIIGIGAGAALYDSYSRRPPKVSEVKAPAEEELDRALLQVDNTLFSLTVVIGKLEVGALSSTTPGEALTILGNARAISDSERSPLSIALLHGDQTAIIPAVYLSATDAAARAADSIDAILKRFDEKITYLRASGKNVASLESHLNSALTTTAAGRSQAQDARSGLSALLPGAPVDKKHPVNMEFVVGSMRGNMRSAQAEFVKARESITAIRTGLGTVK